ncbi:hypothetical protein BD289DRAFT_478481 [Coniella lustricola]|uniref:Uncharacterized protein n=1 Tax=Coniella lustricola TaxID=2025994 RepID=A0A2T3AMN4_9PEZI|nr:hypothetical protein BD289DRAFT_478481 [Coniella lustricola]
MIPSATLRETIILVIFGVILVPIAAKRAHDAPGYWQTFSKELSNELSYITLQQYEDQSMWRLNAYDEVPFSAHELTHNMTLPLYTASSTPRSTRLSTPAVRRTASTTTIRFQMADKSSASDHSQANAKLAANEPSSDATTPSTPPPTSTSATKPQQAAQIKSAAEPPVMVKASEANRGSWRLIWMGCAMAAVAAFMSLC